MNKADSNDLVENDVPKYIRNSDNQPVEYDADEYYYDYGFEAGRQYDEFDTTWCEIDNCPGCVWCDNAPLEVKDAGFVNKPFAELWGTRK